MESLTEVADRSDFAVFVFAGDDVTSLRGGVPASRSNAVFELGFLAGRLGTRNTCVVLEDPSKVVLPSDLAGMMSVSLPSMESSSLGSMVAPAAAVIQRQVADIRRREDRPVEYYSCFISYSWSDKDFAVRLHDDLQSVGVRCWLDAKELKIGDSLQDQIDRAIQVHDKVLLVLSQASVRSAWVRAEVRNALELERARKKTVLFPVRVDDAVLEASDVDELRPLRERYIGDFSAWQNHSHYQRAFSSLVRDLATSASAESGEHA